MAAKKKAEEAKNYERVPVEVSYESEDDDDEVTVIVNGRAIKIKRDERVMVPPEYKAVLDNAREMRQRSKRYIQQIHREQKDVTGL